MSGVGAIVLAAGGSSRLGHSKQLVEFQGVPLVRRAALAAFDSGARPVVVVVGADAEKVLAAIHGLNGISGCTNHAWQSGIASSLISGLSVIQPFPDIDGVLVTLADQPFVGTRHLSELIRVFLSGKCLVASKYQDVIGVPAVFGREYFDALQELSGDKGASSFLRSRAGEVAAISLSGADLDIDTEDDVAKLRTEDSDR